MTNSSCRQSVQSETQRSEDISALVDLSDRRNQSIFYVQMKTVFYSFLNWMDSLLGLSSGIILRVINLLRWSYSIWFIDEALYFY